MKTVASPCKIVPECYQRQGNSRKLNHRREDVLFWPSKKLVTAGFLPMVSAKYNGINLVAASSSTSSLPPEPQVTWHFISYDDFLSVRGLALGSSPETIGYWWTARAASEAKRVAVCRPGDGNANGLFKVLADVKVNLETSETEEKEPYETRKRVRVKFQIQKECSFGEEFMIVGDDRMLGLWSPAGAIPLHWSEGHVWTVELDVPAEETIQYKFILKGINGTISWEPGPDRILKTWDTEKTIFVWEDWGNGDVQKITEEEPSTDDDTGPEITSEMLIVADIMTHRDENIDSKVGNGSVTADADPKLRKKPVSVQGKQLVAHNIDHQQEKPIALDVDNINHLEEDGTVKTNNQLAAESSQEANGRVPPVAKSLSMDVKEIEGEAVLVPGLSPVSESFNIEISIAFDERLGVDEVSGHQLPEPDEKHESKNNQHRAKMIDVINKNQQFESGIKQEPVEHVVNEVLDKDIQWGRRTIQSLLGNFRLLWHE